MYMVSEPAVTALLRDSLKLLWMATEGAMANALRELQASLHIADSKSMPRRLRRTKNLVTCLGGQGYKRGCETIWDVDISLPMKMKWWGRDQTLDGRCHARGLCVLL